MNLYAESSAVLGWLLGEARGPQAQQLLASAEIVSCSDLTFMECGRVLIRATRLGQLSETEARLSEATYRRRAQVEGVPNQQGNCGESTASVS